MPVLSLTQRRFALRSLFTSEEVKEIRNEVCNAIANDGPGNGSEKESALKKKWSIIMSDRTGVETE